MDIKYCQCCGVVISKLLEDKSNYHSHIHKKYCDSCKKKKKNEQCTASHKRARHKKKNEEILKSHCSEEALKKLNIAVPGETLKHEQLEELKKEITDLKKENAEMKETIKELIQLVTLQHEDIAKLKSIVEAQEEEKQKLIDSKAASIINSDKTLFKGIQKLFTR